MAPYAFHATGDVHGESRKWWFRTAGTSSEPDQQAAASYQQERQRKTKPAPQEVARGTTLLFGKMEIQRLDNPKRMRVRFEHRRIEPVFGEGAQRCHLDES
jgi:hypothetical protein